MSLGRREFFAGTLAAALAGRARAATSGAVRRAVPFRAGRSDLDSGIACARMAMSFFEPDEHFPVADLSEMTNSTNGHWFLEPQLAPIMIQKARKVEIYSDLDYRGLADGRGLDRLGPNAEKMLDRKALQWALNAGAAGVLRPGLDLAAILEKFRAGGFLMIAADRGVLRGASLPYCRYFVAVTGFDAKSVRFHDPSLGPDRELPLSQMAQAFATPQSGRAAVLIRG